MIVRAACLRLGLGSNSDRNEKRIGVKNGAAEKWKKKLIVTINNALTAQGS